MPFKNTLGLNVFGKQKQPETDDSKNYYLGTRINVEVGQLLVVSCFLWHATALPKPIFGKVDFDSYYVTNADDRLHFYLGCNEIDVDDMNLTVPDGETGTKSTTAYEVCYVNGLTDTTILDSSQLVYKKEQIFNV